MKVFAKVLALWFLILLAAIVGGRAKMQQQKTPRPVKALYKQRCAACHEGAVPRAPNRARLKQMSSENVRVALLGGSRTGTVPGAFMALHHMPSYRESTKSGSAWRLAPSAATCCAWSCTKA